MGAQQSLNRLRFEDPTAAAAVIDALWEALAREEPRMFAALWRRANRPSRRPAAPEPLIPAQWLDELPPLEVVSDRFPSVDLSPPQPAAQLSPQPAVQPAAQLSPQLVFQPSPSLAELLPSADSIPAQYR